MNMQNISPKVYHKNQNFGAPEERAVRPPSSHTQPTLVLSACKSWLQRLSGSSRTKRTQSIMLFAALLQHVST